MSDYIGCGKVVDFYYVSDLHLMRARTALRRDDSEVSYALAKPYCCLVDVVFPDALGGTKGIHRIIVPAGFKTDLTSVPRCFRRIVGRVGKHLEAAIVHDWLYASWFVYGLDPNRFQWRFANDVMYSAMRKANVPAYQIWTIKAGLELPHFSWKAFSAPKPDAVCEID